MGLINKIQNFKLFTKNPKSISKYLTDVFHFSRSLNNELVLRSNSASIIINSHHYSSIDTVNDIALDVQDVDEVVRRAKSLKAEILLPPQRMHTDNGSIYISKIKSIVGNVVHTILDTSNYSGKFLPDVGDSENLSVQSNQFVKRFDHVTFAVQKGMSDKVINWYSDMFDMKRFYMNSEEDLDLGFIIKHKDKGMILKAIDYWKCSKKGVSSDNNSCKFIIAEELSDKVPNQIGTFLKEHEGPGVQHVGLLTDDIIEASNFCTKAGGEFMIPPQQYYSNIKKNSQINSLKLPLSDLQKFGILIDIESGSPTLKSSIDTHQDSSPPHSSSDRHMNYLMQVFTNPIFDRNTFFFELIERKGAVGFGAGNIKALWDAVDATLMDEEKLKKEIRKF